MRRQFTPEQDQRLAREYEAGATLAELAAKHGGTTTSVRSAVRRGGGVTRKGGTPTGWSPECAPEMLRLYREGASVKTLAARYRTRDAVISAALAEAGAELHPGAKFHPALRTPEQCQEVRRRYEDGAGLTELARETGASAPAVKAAIRRAGGEIRRPGRSLVWTPERIAWAVAEYEGGRSQEDIARELGVAQSAVSRRLWAAGVDTRGVTRRGPEHHSWERRPLG